MSDIRDSISVTSITADAGNIQSINSDSITNSGSISTDTLATSGHANVGGNLNVNGNIQVYGRVILPKTVAFSDVAYLADDVFVVRSDLIVEGAAEFPRDTHIATETFNNTEEGIISVQNIRAANRIIVGDSALKIDAPKKTITADTFTEILHKLVSDKAEIASLTFETARGDESFFNSTEIANLIATNAQIKKLAVEDFTAATQFTTKDLVIDGSAIVSGGITINGASRNEGALVVNSYPGIFNRGIKVFSREGIVTQTISVIGTTDTTGNTTSETVENRYALITAPGVRSMFQGPVTVQDANVTFDNAPVVGEKVVITDLTNTSDTTPSLEIRKGNYNWDGYVDGQLTYGETEEQSSDEFITEDDIRARGLEPYVGRANDKTSKVSSRGTSKRNSVNGKLLAKTRSVNVSAIAKPFTVKTNGANYRIDSAGNILARKAVIEEIRSNKIVANELTASTFRTGNFVTDNVSVGGVVNAASGASVAGTSQLDGTLYNRAEVINRDTAKVVFQDQSSETFKNGSILKVQAGGSLVTDANSVVSIHGDVEIDMANLVLIDSRTGKRYRFLLRDATEEEADNLGEVTMEFGEIEPEATREPVATTIASATKARRALSDELEAFQARLQKI